MTAWEVFAETAAESFADGIVQYQSIGDVELESGASIPAVVLAYESWGKLNADASNAVLIQHALTGSTHVARGDSDEDGWWDGLVGPGKAIDTNRFFVVAANILGGCYGSTGPSSLAPDGVPWGSRFPYLTLRDSVRSEAVLSDALGIQQWHAVIGGSMGGARALEWAAEFPDRLRHVVVLASCGASTAEQIALAQTQVLAIRQDANFDGGDYYSGLPPLAGLGLARRIAHISYRSEAELGHRFGRAAQGGEQPISIERSKQPGLNRYQVESYLDHQATKLVQRFDANSYIVLTEALMSHDVGRGRGGLEQALLASAGVRFTLASVSSDRLYLPAQTEQLAAAVPGGVSVQSIDSKVGHDAFLLETEQIAALIAPALA